MTGTMAYLYSTCPYCDGCGLQLRGENNVIDCPDCVGFSSNFHDIYRHHGRFYDSSAWTGLTPNWKG